ncbi:MAG: PEP-CTERM sorting domain-containing protein, partial [Desulfobacterales bacterium]|nr:PEP-CTERM sorting domain-containing protein [Desulfobacterales bacterium]
LFTILFLFLISPISAFANPVDAISTSQVGVNPFDMDGMSVTVQYLDTSGALQTETDRWSNNMAGGTDWSLTFNGTNTGSFGLDWVLSADNGASIQNITIDAYAEQRTVFDIVFRYPGAPTDEGTFGSSSGLWGPSLQTGTDQSGTVAADSVFLPTGEEYDGIEQNAFYWAFTGEVLLNTYPSSSPQPTEQDLFETLYLDFVRDANQAVLGDGMASSFQFAVDTDTIAGREIPEPTTMLLFGFGLLGLSAVGRKKV